MLLVGFNPADASALAAFRAKFAVPANVLVAGPWSGRLANDSDSVELVKPDAVQPPPHPDAGFVPQILVDKVHYSSLTPWPSNAANGAQSLQRIASSAYGNDPINWQAGVPTAGRAPGEANPDADADGLPDAWEQAYFGTLSRDGTGDFDADGLSDRQEFLAGTNPADNASYLKVDFASTLGGICTLGFSAVSGKTYAVLYRDEVDSGTWLVLTNLPAASTTGPVSVVDPNLSRPVRIYRIVTPAP
jgi:hypothetical protein